MSEAIVSVNCEICQNAFNVPFRKVLADRGKYCSVRCYRKSRKIIKISILDRIRVKIKYDKSGCWIWTGSVNGKGYGITYSNGKNTFVHRIIYELFVSEIPINMNVLHKCDNPLCVNPKHLFLGTQYDNVHDMISKGRQAVGERTNSTPLKPDDVLKIREWRKNSKLTMNLLGELFGVATTTIFCIIHRKTWKHI